MIEFPTVAKEIRSLISRRGELCTFLGSVFAAAGLVLRNALGGNLPGPLSSLEGYIFRFYAVMLMVPSLILALRMARLHGGMVLNGMLYARLMQEQDFTRKGNVEAAARHNYAGVSFLQFVLADFIAAFSAAVLALTFGFGPWGSLAAGGVVFAVWLGMYFRYHGRAAAFARKRIAAEACEPFTKEDWEEHVAACLEDANHGLIANVGFVGLMTFSVFEMLGGLGEIKASHAPEIQASQIRDYGAEAYTVLMLVSCLMGLITYLRVRVAIGRFSLDLDPTDRPFRTLTLTDSLLGYLIVAFFTAVAVHLLLIQVAPGLDAGLVFGIDLVVFALAVLAEQLTLVSAGRAIRPHVAGEPGKTG